MAVEVAAFVGTAAEQHGAYYGRDVSEVIVEVEKIQRLEAEDLPIVRAQIDARVAHLWPDV
ncbi:hypothetical protein [Pseudonocardia alaniniphila]|uniref:Uncharacterized protein n=1 Tax=Pseudonocardia alaniniphila TaxID=75291 RepID=A0ABS9TRX0_9PSEU|nr:hypothetical protein [Pseudonocardia alaniniphila]MCH6171302.1 hypothetical protein [Pseudonocardia alaniniphila]